MIPTLFVTGTDTGVGKTRVSTALVAAWTQHGHRIAVMKPVETGWPARAEGSDAAQLLAATGRPLDLDLVCPFRYAMPASPATAAHLEGRPAPSLPAILDAHRRLSDGADLVLVEGAGGLLVPLGAALLTADLVAALGATLLVVAATRLGTVNHTLLTLECARHRRLPVAGLVLNQRDALAGPEEVDLPRLFAEYAPQVPLLGSLPHGIDRPDLATLARIAVDHLAPTTLWEALGSIARPLAP